jgi:spore coat protein CotH
VLIAACATDAPPADPESGVPDSGVGDSGPDYATVFDASYVHTYQLLFEPEEWHALEEEWTTYVRADVIYDGATYEDVGVRFKGNVSLEFAGEKKSFKLNFNKFVKGQTFHGLDMINLHNGFKDPTIMREDLAYGAHQAAGDLHSRTCHARVLVTVPGTYDAEYFGLYINVEAVNRDYLQDKLGDDGGTLYKGGDFRWHGPDWQEYVPWIYEPKTNEESDDHEALLRFLDVLNNTPIAELGNEIEQVFDVDRFAGWLAANTLLSNMDGIPVGGGNCYLYHDVTRDVMVLIPWDMNEAFGSTSEGLSLDELLTLDIHHPVVWPGASPLIERLLLVPEFVDEYEARLAELLDGYFAVASLNAVIDDSYALIKDDVYADTKRHYSIEQFEQSIEDDVPGLPNPPYPDGNMVIGLKRFVDERVASVTDQLQ